MPVTSSGGPEASTNIVETGQTYGTIFVSYEFYSLADRMTVYYEAQKILDSGEVSNSGSWSVNYGPGTSTEVYVVMNEGGSADSTTAWFYSLTYTQLTPYYLTFTENTNLATVPIKFAPVPIPVSPTGTYYLPEQPLDRFAGEPAAGRWTLQVTDTRAGATEPAPTLVTWQLALKMENPMPAPIPISSATLVTNTVAPGQVQFFSLAVPAWAGMATNTLAGASGPVSLLFNQNFPPVGTNAGDYTLLTNVTSGSAALLAGGMPPLAAAATCFLGVLNTNTVPVTFVLEVNFDVTALGLKAPLTVTQAVGPLGRYFSYEVKSNETGVQFAISNENAQMQLVVKQGLPYPDLGNYDYGSFSSGTNGQQVIVFTNSSPVPLAAGLWYVGVFDASGTDATYTLTVSDWTNAVPVFTELYDGGAYAASNAGGESNIDYYEYRVYPGMERAQFEVNGPSGNVALVLRKGLPLPDLSSYDYSSFNPGTNDQLVTVFDYSSPVALSPGEWFAAVVNLSGGAVSYTVKATTWGSYGTNLLAQSPSAAGNEFCFSWDTLSGVHYFIQGKTNVTDAQWTMLESLTATDYTTSYCLALPSGWHFFRIGEGIVPLAITSAPRIALVTKGTNGVALRWPAAAGSTFQVQWTASLTPASWSTFTNVVAPSAGLCTFVDDGTQTGGMGGTRFYRLVVGP